MSGYAPDEDLKNHDAEAMKDKSEIIVRAPEKEYVEPTLLKGGFDFAFLMEAPKEECLRRCKGRRIDPKTGIMYHMDDNPPNTSDHALMDRLEPV